MNPQTQTLYTVQGCTGAHLLITVRATQQTDVPNVAGHTADVQLIGAPLPFSVPAATLRPFDAEAPRLTEGDPITLLAQEAVLVYSLDPARVQRASVLARQVSAVQNARRDEHGEQITPSLRVQCVKGSKGWYVVRPNFCTCPDHAKGNTCKHRIAAWMHRESIVRPLAQARRVQKSVIMAELGAS